MAVSKKYSLAAIQLDDAVDVLISGITTQGLSTQTQVDQEPTSGEIYARFHAISGQDPTGRFSTYHLATALFNIGLAGLSIGGLATGLVLWLQKHLEGGTRTGAGANRKFQLTEGLIVPRTLSVPHGPGHATLTYEIIGTYDGTNDPFTITDSQNLPTAEDDDERFTLGPMQIGAKTLTHIRAFDLDFGINVVAEGADGDIWPTFASIESITPSIRLQGIDPEWMAAATIPLAGLACTHANTLLYLRKRAIGGTFVANGVAQHIKFTAAGLAYIDDAIDAAGSGASEASLVLPLRFDGTTAPLTIDVASTIV